MFLLFLLILSISIYAAVKIHTNADTHYSQNYYSNRDEEDSWALFKNIDHNNGPPLFKCPNCNQYLTDNKIKFYYGKVYCLKCYSIINEVKKG